MVHFEKVDLESVDWDGTLRTFEDRTIYQTSAWLSFVAEAQNAQPLLAVLREGSNTLGYFTGLIVYKVGFRILGSPFPGWTTPYMGFNLLPGASRRRAVEVLSHFVFGDLGCIHLEVVSRYLTPEDISGLGFDYDTYPTSVVDLTQSEEELLASMTHDCRSSLRASIRRGVTIEEAHDVEFADEYCVQLQEVFARQSLVPSYGAERVRLLIKYLYPAGMLLMLRARDQKGRCIATGLFVGTEHEMNFWGGAGWHEYQGLRPNEAIHWYAIRYWKSRGARLYDPGGITHFKKKFGGHLISVMRIRKSKYCFVPLVRELAKRVVKTRQHLMTR